MDCNLTLGRGWLRRADKVATYVGELPAALGRLPNLLRRTIAIHGETCIIRKPILTYLPFSVVDYCILFFRTLLAAPASLLLPLSRVHHQLPSPISGTISLITAIIPRSFLTGYSVNFLRVFCQSDENFVICIPPKAGSPLIGLPLFILMVPNVIRNGH